MHIKDVEAIRETIRLAQTHEAETGHLKILLQTEAVNLHNAIRLPDDNPAGILLEFITRYIEHVPDFVEAITHVTNDAHIYDYANTFLCIAKEFFLHPPEVVDGHQGMDALMDEAYLAHRLMEEVNDRFIGHCGIPLAPMDMTRSNLIIHHLIGEPFANELDLAIQYAVERLLSKESVFENEGFLSYMAEHKHRGWDKELKEWPCLAQDLTISLNFEQQPSPMTDEALH